VVGIGCRFPDADDVHAFWSNIEAGKTAFSDVPTDRWHHEFFYSATQRDVDKTWAPKGSFIDRYKEFAALHYGLAPRRLEVMDPQQRLLIEATRWALQDAGFERTGFDRRRTGVFTGVSVSEFKNITQARMHAMQMVAGDYGTAAGEELREQFMALTGRIVPMRAFTLSGSLTALNAAAVAQVFDLGGPAYTIDSACASASVAIHNAVMMLRAGALDSAVAGGAYVNLSPDNLIAFTKIGAISPTGACRPFDERADGFVQSDGVGMVVLKRLSDAQADGDRVHAVILGSGCNNDGRGEGPMTPRREGQLEVLRAAYEDAQIAPGSVGYFEAHGTATSIGDPVEVQALGSFLQASGSQDEAWIGSVKGNIGHAMSAAGIAGFIKAIDVLRTGRVHPQPNFHKAHPKLRLDEQPLKVPTEATPLPTRDGTHRVAVSSFGFGGTNSHLVLQAPPPRPEAPERPYELPSGKPEAILITGASIALLAAHCGGLADFLETGPGKDYSLADVAFTLNARRQREQVRAVIGARSRYELVRHLRDLKDRLAEGPELPLSVSPHVMVVDRDPRITTPPKLAFLFPGQGAQRVGALEDLRHRFPTYASTFRRLSDATRDQVPEGLEHFLYPDRGDEAAQLAALTRTEVCQPALAASSLALRALLAEVGVESEVSLGHSLGEFCALADAGAASTEDTVRLVAERGAVMARLQLPDPGAMAAVMAEASVVRDRIQGLEGVVVANVNHPRQCVLSGTTPSVQAASKRLEEQELDVRPLSVSHAFHSPLMEAVAAGLGPRLEETSFAPPRKTVASCVRPAPYDEDVTALRRTLVEHATAPVLFARGLEQAQAAGAEVFVQLGSGKTLLAFARATLGRDLPTVVLADDAPDGGYSFVRGLCHLAALGAPVAFDAVYAGEGRQVVSLPETPLVREEYWPVKNQPQPQTKFTAPAPRDPEVTVVRAPAAPASLPATANASAPASMPAVPTGASSELVALFREQLALLQRQTEVMAAQAQALGGAGAALPSAEAEAEAEAAVAVEAPRPTLTPAPAPTSTSTLAPERPAAETNPPKQTAPVTAAPSETSKGEDAEVVRKKVFELVSRVSAFPEDSLRPDQRLVDELGFDSLMVADLGGAIDKAFPGSGGLPQDLFSLSTTVEDVAKHLVAAVTAAGPNVEPQKTPESASTDAETVAPAESYRARAVPASPATGRTEVQGQVWLVTEDDGPLSESISAGLTAAGAQVVRVRFTRQGVAAPSRLSTRGVNFWPAEYADGLPEALRTASLEPVGFVHAAGLASTQDPSRPLELLHPLVHRLRPQRLAVLTDLGGKMGLEKSPRVEGRLPQATLQGYTKALARERKDVAIKAVDVDGAAPVEQLSTMVLNEILSTDAEVEVGLAEGRRWVAKLEPAADQTNARQVRTDDVVLVTGGAGALGARVAMAIATRRPKGIILSGRRPQDPEIEALVGRLRAAGCEAAYVSANVRKAETLRASVAEAGLGLPTVVVHAAGFIADAPADEKSMDGVLSVLGPKLGGLFALVDAFPQLRDLVLFSSWAGRFGNASQVDYAAANQALDVAAVAGVGAPRVLSIAWPPWRGTSMVDTIPTSVQAMMEKAGVTFLEPEEGVEVFMRLFESDARGLRVVGRRLSGADVSVDEETRFDVERHGYLTDHALKGRPVVPLAVILDWVARAVRRVVGAEIPVSLDSFELVRGVMGGETAHLHIDGRWVDDGLEGEVEIRVGEQVAYRARLGREPETEWTEVETNGASAALSLDDFYRDFTFHGPRLKGIEGVDGIGAGGIKGRVRGVEAREWGVEESWALDPLALDSAFQLGGYWTSMKLGRTGFPTGIDHVTIMPWPASTPSLQAGLRFSRQEGDGFEGDLGLRDAEGRVMVRMRGLKGRFADVRTETAPGSNETPRETAPKSNGTPRETAPRSDGTPRPHANGQPNGNGANGHGPLAGASPALDVPDAHWKVAAFPELGVLGQRFAMAEKIGVRNPYFRVHDGTARDTSVVEGVSMVNFSSYNYLGFSGHPEVVAAAQASIEAFGTSVSASRVASGERPLHQELEKGLAQHVGVEDAIVMVSGHATNVTTVGHVMGREDLVLHDSLIHDSILQGIYLSGATRRPFPHNDFDAAEKTLAQVRKNFRRVLLVAEGIYSMDGDTTDLPRLIELKRRYKTLLMIDEAHSIGVLGPAGRGIAHHYENVDPNDVDIWMGTLSKSFASCGGYIAGSKELIQYLKYTAPGFVYSAGLPPPNAAAALKSLELMNRHPEVVEQLRARSRFFVRLLRERGIDTGDAIGAAVVPAIIGNSVHALRLSEALGGRRINVQPIVYPAVEENASRLRFFISATHTEAQLRQTADAIVEELTRIQGAEGASAVSL